MTTRRKVAIGLGVYFLATVIVAVVFGWTRDDNDEFQPQNEFKLETWIALPGPFDINKAVLYVFIAAALTVGTMVYVARRMQQRPNRLQTAVEVAYTLMRDNITRGNMDKRMAAKWFPFIATLFLFIWFSNMIGYIPLPTNTEHKVDILGVSFPTFRSTPPPRTSRSRSCSRSWCGSPTTSRGSGPRGRSATSRASCPRGWRGRWPASSSSSSSSRT